MFNTAKSRAVELTLGGKYFVPVSQTVSMSEDADENGNRLFEVTSWWWDRKQEMDEQ